ncbi:MAG: GH92 family glycosyl hydrolase [Crocinitomicaceae bacterium]|jgi:predicted alpha-1,2-mannosidase|nr:GH92 family glycosyl hydrolase [Crocinitomicaceae bacterium]
MRIISYCLALICAFVLNLSHAQNELKYVKPLIGTAKMGHTFPGASVPFGMVQLSPDTDTLQYEVDGKYNGDVYKYCAGYQYDDPTIVGFSHTHFSGTGHSDLGDILVMPTSGKIQMNPGVASDPTTGYRSAYQHTNEKAEPNYYSVLLDDHQIQAELTTTTRVGMHRYSYSQAEDAHIVLDLNSGIYPYEGKNVWTFVRVENDTLITGYRQTNGWARTRTVYFAISLSEPIKSYQCKKRDNGHIYRGFWRKFNDASNFPEVAGLDLVFNLDFDLPASKQVMMKVALSPTSTNGALMNLKAECPTWDFDKVVKDGQNEWLKELQKVKVTTMNESDAINFYTALYHTCLGPTVYSDVDGSYKGLDQNIYKAENFTNYTTFSLWDTYRALHPWFNLVQAKRNNDMVESMLAHYDQSVLKMLPIWSHYANDNWCMIGYHAVSVISDAALNPLSTFDKKRALDACVQTANNAYFDGIPSYIKYKYVPEDHSGSSVSKTLEYAFDDYSIARLAALTGDKGTETTFLQRAGYFENVYDSSIGYMRPKKANGEFLKDFDVLNTHQRGFIEGNAWNYSLYVPHNVPRMIEMMGGNKTFASHLDSLFTMELPDKYFEHTEDISRDGIIGNYVHGNEPSHHVVYLFNYANREDKTQAYLRKVIREMYRPVVDGLGGNDDCGQMSAWYLFSSLGFYPVAPSSGVYSIGAPLVVSAEMTLDNGKVVKVETKNQSEKNKFVKAVYWNNVRLDEPFISFQQLNEGGILRFEMTSKPQNTFQKN